MRFFSPRRIRLQTYVPSKDLCAVIDQFPKDPPVALFVFRHQAPNSSSEPTAVFSDPCCNLLGAFFRISI